MNQAVNTPTLDLWQLNKGQRATIVGYAPEIAPNIRVRLTELGFREGARVDCTLKPRLGAPRFYRVANSVYSLERDVAHLIRVELLN